LTRSPASRFPAKRKTGANSLGICPVSPYIPPELRRNESASDRETPLITGVNGTLMARPGRAGPRKAPERWLLPEHQYRIDSARVFPGMQQLEQDARASSEVGVTVTPSGTIGGYCDPWPSWGALRALAARLVIPSPSAHPPGERSKRHGVKVERPTGRTTLTHGAWSARLCLGRWRRDGQTPTSATRQHRPGCGVHPGARGPLVLTRHTATTQSATDLLPLRTRSSLYHGDWQPRLPDLSCTSPALDTASEDKSG
jgi:hypothetical protein